MALSAAAGSAEGSSPAPPPPPLPRLVLVAGTRLHLGNASTPPEQDKLYGSVRSFLSFAAQCGAARAAIAVEAEPRIEGYDLPSAVRDACDRVVAEWEEGSFEGRVDSSAAASAVKGDEGGRIVCKAGDENDDEPLVRTNAVNVDVIPISPWGKFVPALNALVSWSASHRASLLLLASAETNAAPESIHRLCDHIDAERTLVAGAALPGHDYEGICDGDSGATAGGMVMDLNGRTTPWNTLAVWNVPKLALTGFPLVSDGLHPNEDGSDAPSGVEEVAAIALLQRILPKGTADAKLVRVPGVKWDQEWTDEERQAWHEKKMRSKLVRARRHKELLGLTGSVIHC